MTDNWFLQLLKHPLLIACISTGLFGIIVAYLGSWFQHKNWIRQDEIAHTKTIEDKLFDKRAEIAKEMFYLIAKKENCTWSIYDKGISLKLAKKARDNNLFKELLNDLELFIDENREIVSKSYALVEEIKIYFNMDEDSKLVTNFVKIVDIMQDTIERLNNLEDLTKEDVKKKLEEIKPLKDEIHEILFKRIYNLKLLEEEKKT